MKDLVRSQCTILFEEPFWIGLFEKWEENCYSVCRVVFGKEPTSSEIYEWMLACYGKLSFKETQRSERPLVKKLSPKKLKKQITRQVNGKYQGTKAQQTLKSLYAEEKVVRKKLSRQEQREEQVRQFELKQTKKKQKKRGH